MLLRLFRYHDDEFGAIESGDELEVEERAPKRHHRPYSDGNFPIAMADRSDVEGQESADWFCGLLSREKAEVMDMWLCPIT